MVWAWILGGAAAVGGVLLFIVASALGDAALSATLSSVLRRPEWARRRANERGGLRVLLPGAYLCLVIAFVASWLAYVAGTNGYPDDAWVWGAGGALLVVVAVGLFASWWRLAGRPRHY
jgi:hypothetical protein